MNCKQIQLALVEHEDGERPDSIREHLFTCDACRQAAERADTFKKLMALKRYEVPDPGFPSRSLDRICRRNENLEAEKETETVTLWELLLGPRPAFRLALAAILLILWGMTFALIPRRPEIKPQLVGPKTRLSFGAQLLATRSNATLSPNAPQLVNHPSPTNSGPIHIDYGTKESVPVKYEY